MSETPRTVTEAWKWRRREAIIRDEYTCQECGAKGGPEGDAELHAHHLTPAAEGGADDAENLETLCKCCHLDEHRANDRETVDCTQALRNPERDEKTGRYVEEYSREDVLAALAALGGSGGTQEVADAAGAKYDTTYKKLRQLEDADRVTRRKIGNANLWMLPKDEDDV